MSPRHAATPVLEPVAAPRGLPRLLTPGVTALAAHAAQFGPLPALARRGDRAAFIDSVERAGIRGRGGAGFPTATKLRAVASGGRGAVVVANGAEGEPASAKDATLLLHVPHLVLDGAVVAARSVRANQVFVVVDRAKPRVRDAVARAIAERAETGADEVAMRLVELPGRYVAGEESAVVHFIDGGEAKPTFVPPRPYERGVRGRPTLVQNVETLANLALLARFGNEWHRTLGTTGEPGSVLVTLVGAIAQPAVYEIATGTTVGALVDTSGGATEPLAAVLVGGYFGRWIPASRAADVELSHDGLRQAGGTLGCGVVAAFPAGRCGVAETARIARYLAEESAGQCGPCVHGLGAVSGGLAAIASGRTRGRVGDDVSRWLGDIAHRGACHLPDAAVGFVGSAREVFAEDFEMHERHGRCLAGSNAPLLPLPDPAGRDWGWR